MAYEEGALLRERGEEQESLFLSLLVDPLFIELAHGFREKPWGSLKGATLYTAVSAFSQIEVLAALWYVWFGRPRETVVNRGVTSFQVLFLYNNWTLQWVATISKETLFPSPILQGSFLFSSAMVEFRYGSERWIAVSPDGERVYHLPLPEPYVSLYLGMHAPGGVLLPDGATKKAAWDFAYELKLTIHGTGEKKRDLSEKGRIQ